MEQSFLLLIYFPTWLPWPGMDQAEAESLELHPGLPRRWQEPKDLDDLLSQVHRQDLNWHASVNSSVVGDSLTHCCHIGLLIGIF